MRRILLLLILLFSILLARFDAEATKSCEAWNDLRGTRNEGNLILKPGKDYQVIREHKGHYLIRIENTPPTQRWVLKECLKPLSKSSYHKSSKAINLLLALSWQNSFCETHPNKKECRPLYNRAKNHLVLHGLWPQPASKSYCNVPKSIISKDKHHQWRSLPAIEYPVDLKKEMLIYMPGIYSSLDRHEWIKHGTCYTSDPIKYFLVAIKLTKEVDNSLVGEYLRANVGGRVNIINIRKIFDRAFGKGSGSKVSMVCKRGLLSELRINLKGSGESIKDLIVNAPKAKKSCKEAIVDAP